MIVYVIVNQMFRKHCIALMEWKPFEFFILLTIMGNCICLAIYTPFPNGDSNDTNAILVSAHYNLPKS